jgi:hypothetical protein
MRKWYVRRSATLARLTDTFDGFECAQLYPCEDGSCNHVDYVTMLLGLHRILGSADPRTFDASDDVVEYIARSVVCSKVSALLVHGAQKI